MYISVCVYICVCVFFPLKYSLSTYYLQGTDLDAGIVSMNKTEKKNPVAIKFTSSGIKQNKQIITL